MSDILRRVILCVVFLLIGILIWFTINSFLQTPWNKDFDFGDRNVNLPNYLVFFATAISACLLYITLNDQRKANQIAAFENRFFKFIDYHRENVEKMRYPVPYKEEKTVVEGKLYFVNANNEIRLLLKRYFENEVKKGESISHEFTRNGINLIYSCFFYGARSDKREQLKRKFPSIDFKSIGFDKIAKYSKYYKCKSLFHTSVKNVTPYPYYTGHVNRLGNYFRNIYQTLRYVDEQKFLTPNQKYNYIKHFRAQISAYEQVLIFYNSISDLGKSMELEQYNRSIKGLSKKRVYRQLLLTKYDFIRNTPYIDSDNIVLEQGNVVVRISDFYPLLCSEHQDECSIVGTLPFVNNDKKICRYCFNRKYIEYKNVDAKRKIKEYFSTEERRKSFDCDEVGCRTKRVIKNLDKSRARMFFVRLP